MASQLASVLAVLGFWLVAGSAQAQFLECIEPTDIPERVFDTILDEASFNFGDASDKACNSIVKEGTKTCRAQVKAAAKCFDLALNANNKISATQCKELEDAESRADCKAESKAERDLGKTNVEESKNEALAICDDDFAEELADACLAGIPI